LRRGRVGVGIAPVRRPRRATHEGKLSMKHWLILMGILGGASAGVARGEPYWVAWEGDDFPENEGWERRMNGEGPALRTLADGVMNIDGLWSTQVDDFYRLNRPLDPEAGEMFVMQWRLRVNEVIGNPLALYDPGVGLFSDQDNELTLVFGVDFVRSYHEEGVVIPLGPGVFHEYEVRSSDMVNYELLIDGYPIHAGEFWTPNFRRSGVDWGDYARGAGSSADWDYFRFGVVPEPAS